MVVSTPYNYSVHKWTKYLFLPFEDSLENAWNFLQSQLPSLDLSIFREQETLFLLAIPLLIDLKKLMFSVFNVLVCTILVYMYIRASGLYDLQHYSNILFNL